MGETMQDPASNPLFDLARTAPMGELVPVPQEVAYPPATCLLDVLGMRLTHIGVGLARAEMAIAPVHLNQRGHPQGGALVAFADATAGWASDATLADSNFATIDLTCHLLSRAQVRTVLVALARPVHIGRSALVQEVDVLTSDQEALPNGRLVASFRCTQLVLRTGANPAGSP